MAVKEQVVKPVDKTLLPEKFYLLMNPGNGGWPAEGQGLSYVAFFRDKEKAMGALQVGMILYECSPETRFICKKEIVSE